MKQRSLFRTFTRSSTVSALVWAAGASSFTGCSGSEPSEGASAGASNVAGAAPTAGSGGRADGGSAGAPSSIPAGFGGVSPTGGAAAAGQGAAVGSTAGASSGGGAGGNAGGGVLAGSAGAAGLGGNADGGGQPDAGMGGASTGGGGSSGGGQSGGRPAGGAAGSTGSGTCTPSKPVSVSVSGSGPHRVIVETNSDAGIAEGTIYRPTGLGGAEKYPIFVWGNGACARNGLENRAAMAEIASHGYFVISDGTPNGSGNRNQSSNWTAMGKPLLNYIAWAVAEKREELQRLLRRPRYDEDRVQWLFVRRLDVGGHRR